MATSSPQHSRTFLNPDLEAATADQQPALQALPGQGSANRKRQTDAVPAR